MPASPSPEEARNRVEEMVEDEAPCLDAEPLAGKLSSSIKLAADGVFIVDVVVPRRILARNNTLQNHYRYHPCCLQR